MPVEIRVPQLGDSVVEATVLRWIKLAGDSVAEGDPVVELETDKVNVEIPAESAGTLYSIVRKEGETVQVGDVLGTLSEDEGPKTEDHAPTASSAPSPMSPVPGPSFRVPRPAHEPEEADSSSNGAREGAVVSPVARRLAEENSLDLRLVKGSGPGGRITKLDVATHIERASASPATAQTLARHTAEAKPAQPPIPDSDGRPEVRSRMSRRRQTIATRLVEAQRTAAMLTTFNEADMSAVMEIRKRLKDAFKEKHGVNLGFMSFFTKASISALKAFPLLNAEIQGEEIVEKHYYDIGVAVSTDEGLVVPVLRDADKKSFAGVERGIGELATRAREGKLTLPELQGGTFTITNGGIFGSLMSTPILNTPQVGILGMHKIQERPVAVDGQCVIRPMMYLALSYDHRIVDGAEAVRFLVRVKELIEDPAALLVEG